MQKRNVYTLAIGLLGAAKIALNSFGIDLISDAQINDVANGIAALAAVAGVVMTHLKKNKVAPAPAPVVPQAPAPSAPVAKPADGSPPRPM